MAEEKKAMSFDDFMKGQIARRLGTYEETKKGGKTVLVRKSATLAALKEACALAGHADASKLKATDALDFLRDLQKERAKNRAVLSQLGI